MQTPLGGFPDDTQYALPCNLRLFFQAQRIATFPSGFADGRRLCTGGVLGDEAEACGAWTPGGSGRRIVQPGSFRLGEIRRDRNNTGGWTPSCLKVVSAGPCSVHRSLSLASFRAD